MTTTTMTTTMMIEMRAVYRERGAVAWKREKKKKIKRIDQGICRQYHDNKDEEDEDEKGMSKEPLMEYAGTLLTLTFFSVREGGYEHARRQKWQ